MKKVDGDEEENELELPSDEDERKMSIDMGNQADFDDCLSGGNNKPPSPPIIGHSLRGIQ